MKIEKVDVIPYSMPIRAFADAYTGFSISNAVLVKITTDTGITGFGEGCAWEPEFYGLRALAFKRKCSRPHDRNHRRMCEGSGRPRVRRRAQ
jgi:L-alanine-DL-glutamate epimerase-like enolase superfamily enzyme